MRRMMMIIIILVFLPFAFSVPLAFGGAAINITSAHIDVDANTLTLKGNFDLGSGTLYVGIGGVALSNCTIGATEIVCDLTGHTLEAGTYTVGVSVGSSNSGPSNTVNDDIDVNVSYASESPCKPGLITTCYNGDSSTIGIGECKTGTITCSNNGEWGSCEGEVTPVDEICGDGLDNDCDGQLGNGCEGQLCDDDDFCTENDAYGANEICSGTPKDCDDNNSFTLDSCDPSSGECIHELENVCFIDGYYYSEGEQNPNNECEICDSSAATGFFTPLPNGWPCGDGGAQCTDGVCVTP